MKPTLVVLAAGMGSRYGGLKQIDPVGPSGEAILDYSVFDAIRAGFGRVVFVIRHDIEEAFKSTIGARYAGHVAVDYCFQDVNDLPAPYALPEGRTKPWGTAHAVRAARYVVKEPFAVINADDFLGRDAFRRLGEFLAAASLDDASSQRAFSMVGYRLGNTLSENGTVARGICDVDAQGYLKSVVEMTKLAAAGDHVENHEAGFEDVRLSPDVRVSMQLWGFTPSLFDELECRFPPWLAKNGSLPKSEWYIPFVVNELLAERRATCRVLPTDSCWFGVTYREDKPQVVASIARLVAAGEYPKNLFASC